MTSGSGKADSAECKMCAVVPRNLAKGAVPAPVGSPQPNVWPLNHQSVSLRAPRHPMANLSRLDHDQGDFALPWNPSTMARACPLDPSRFQRGNGSVPAPLDPMTEKTSLSSGHHDQPCADWMRRMPTIGKPAILQMARTHVDRIHCPPIYTGEEIGAALL